MQFVQRFLVPAAHKSSAGHFKAIESAFVFRNVCQKVCIFVCFLVVSCINIGHHWHCELIYVREAFKKKIDFFLGKSPKLWGGGGQES